jgi:hypothetical protein
VERGLLAVAMGLPVAVVCQGREAAQASTAAATAQDADVAALHAAAAAKRHGAGDPSHPGSYGAPMELRQAGARHDQEGPSAFRHAVCSPISRLSVH